MLRMTGVITAEFEAVISLHIHGPADMEIVQAIIDAGFTGYLTLPSALITT